jgi:hypothetical protein
MITVKLNPQELAILDRQSPWTKDNGGWQNLLVTLQEKTNRQSASLTLDVSDLERIGRYAFSYGNGGWENRLRAIFQRTLGPSLGRQYVRTRRAA